MAKKQTTIDDLAVIVKKGFQRVERTMATKEMVKDMATNEMVNARIDDFAVMVQKEFQDIDYRFQSIESQMVTKDILKLVVEGVDIIREDIRDIKITLGPLVRMVAALETDM